MTVKDLMKILKQHPEDLEVVVKNYLGSDSVWSPKDVRYIERLKNDDKLLID